MIARFFKKKLTTRLDIVGGIVFIALGAILIGVKDSMIRLALDLPLFHSFSVFGTASESWALPIVIGVIGAAIFLARVLTKRAPIKI